MRLYIFGASGAGVTTLGQALSEQFGLRYFDGDAYFWEASDPPFTVRRPPYLRNAALASDLAQANEWVLGGCVTGWGEGWPPPADLVVFLWLPPALRLHRLRTREQARYGDIILADPARTAQTQAFLEWAAGYDDSSTGGARTLANHTHWLSRFTCPVLELRGDLSVAQRLQAVQTKLRELELT
ncbi:P-loop NTPase family protein [Hymenobacter terricola]|uniref:adenylate kinase n=1 Tax=Hymenobacter terricola TaxID=2819236 RepID=UPI001B304DA7|nr:adenylate kinase [Hymenobacter terricola]